MTISLSSPIKSAAEIIADIDKLAKDAYRSKESPETLSMIVAELAILNLGLGNWLADALEAERNLDRDLKLARQRIILELRKTKTAVSEAEAKAQVQTEDTWNELLDVQHAVQLYKIKRNDTQTLIDAIRSRLAVIREDIRQEAQ